MKNTYLLPLYKDTYYTYTVNLGVNNVKLSFLWNNKTTAYHLTVSQPDGTVLIDGVRIVPDFKILTSASFAAGLRGAFSLTAINADIEDNETNRKNLADNYLFSYEE